MAKKPKHKGVAVVISIGSKPKDKKDHPSPVPMAKSFGLFKANPNQQMWSKNPLYGETAYGQSDHSQTRRVGTVHPAIESLLGRDTENAATDVRGGGYLSDVHENPTPLSREELDRIRMYDMLNRDSTTPDFTTHSNNPRVQQILSTNPKAPLQMPSENVGWNEPYGEDMTAPGKTKRIEWTAAGGEQDHDHPYGSTGHAGANAPAIQPPKGSNQDMIDRFGVYDPTGDAHVSPSEFGGIGGDYHDASDNPMYAPYRGSNFMWHLMNDPEQPWGANEDALERLSEDYGFAENPMEALSAWESEQREKGKQQRLAREAKKKEEREAAMKDPHFSLFG